MSVIGKKAYKNSGFFSGLVGIIQKGDDITPYRVVFSDGSSVGARLSDLIIVD